MHEALLELALPPQRLEAGALVPTPLVALWTAGPGALPPAATPFRMAEDHAASIRAGRAIRRSQAECEARHASLTALQADATPRLDDAPIALVVHALTGDMRVGGEGGWWRPLTGAGEGLDTARLRILCFNNLGSCYGTSGPEDEGFPGRDADREAWASEGRGSFTPDPGRLPATITPWDQAHLILAALDALGVRRVELLTGGSVGGMIALCLALLAPGRFGVVVPIAACLEASPWLIGFNHVARQMILHDGEAGLRGLALARQLAHMTYRAEPGLEVRQGRRQSPPSGDAAWRAASPYAVQTYLEYQGERLCERFGARAYLAQLDAMDHHDIARLPVGNAELPGARGGSAVAERDGSVDASGGDANASGGDANASGGGRRNAILRRLRAPVHAVGIDSDALFLPEHMRALVTQLHALDRPATYHEIHSLHGHDAFLIEHAQMSAILRHALECIGRTTTAPGS